MGNNEVSGAIPEVPQQRRVKNREGNIRQMRRQEARELFMQMLFQMEMQQDYSRELKTRFFEWNEPGKSQVEYIDTLYEIIHDHLTEIDEKLSEASSNWKVNRISKVDLAILRLAAAEILYFKEIPDRVSINEAVELAKKFGTDDSGRFVNGVLGKVAGEKNETDQ